MTLWKWDKATPLNNATADSTIDWSEGQAPSSVNNSARGMMTAVAKFRDDIAGRITTGGTSTAYTVTSNQVFDTLAHMDGAMIGFVPHASNGATVTLNVDALGAKPLRSAPGIELSTGTLILGTPYVATYNNSDGAWYLQGIAGDLPFALPIGALAPYVGSTAPNANYALPFGQAISRTTYARLFAVTSTTYGVGDGSTTFNLPDLRGRVVAALDNLGGSAASRITAVATDSGTLTGATLGSAAGSQTHVQTTAEMASHNHFVQLNEGGGHSHTVPVPIGSSAGVTNNMLQGTASAGTQSVATTTNTTGAFIWDGTTANQTGLKGSSNGMAILQPTIMLGYIIRVL